MLNCVNNTLAHTCICLEKPVVISAHDIVIIKARGRTGKPSLQLTCLKYQRRELCLRNRARFSFWNFQIRDIVCIKFMFGKTRRE